MKKIVEIKVLENYRIWLRFNDGATGEVDFSSKRLSGVYAPWRDYEYFQRARVDPDGQLSWDDQLDFGADSLWLQITGSKKMPKEFSSNHA